MTNLSNDVVVLVMDAFYEQYSGDLFSFTFSFRTSPPNDIKLEVPCAVFRNISEVEIIRNVGGTAFRDNADIWIHIISKTKAQVTEIKDKFKAWHRTIWKTPGSGMKHIIWKGVTNNDQEDAKPQLFERIIKLEVAWEDSGN